MKKVIVTILLILVTFGVLYAETITLNTTEVIDTPIAVKLGWYISHIDAKDKILAVKYKWLDSNNFPIKVRGSGQSWNSWNCRNSPNENLECTAAGEPYECCTGLGVGTCSEGSTCFTDIFNFNIRVEDVGTPIGVGLRTLIWNQMKGDILTPGNDGVFE